MIVSMEEEVMLQTILKLPYYVLRDPSKIVSYYKFLQNRL